ncbi:MAG: leucyl aminopeptidase [Thermoanaerobaculales bacterium]|jgi:leucyl aminopeptidase|nr:leucyl aminopeptidase [Thermoanaerobaculales bacterium]
MADLYQLREAPEEPLDCIYILQSTDSDPIDKLQFTAKERRPLKAKAEALGPRGEAGELISGECPLALAHRVTFVGVGDERELSHSKLREALGRVMRQATKNREYQIGLGVPVRVNGLTDAESRAFALLEASISDYTFDHFKSKKNEFEKIDGLHIMPLAGESEEVLEQRLQRVRLMRTAKQLARDLGNRPSNDLTPDALAAAVKTMTEEVKGLRVTVLGVKELQKEKMGGILGVSKGSIEEPRLIVIEHRPKKPKKSVVLVGKGVTFDSGGISIKPAAGMGWMKYDMCGAATVVGVMRAIAEMDLPIKIIGLIPAVENMPSGSATRPGDILTMANGKTVEVDNTDAEGRLILADALHFAARFNPDVVLDFATLTGACVVALGHEAAGIMGNDTALVESLRTLGEQTGERVWPLPLYDEYLGYLKSEWADIKNAGNRAGGVVTAGAFLKQFVPEKVSWAHLDIAGVAYHEKEHNGLPKGASGFGVVLVSSFLENLLS